MGNTNFNDYYDIEKNISIAVDDGKSIKLISYSMGDSVEKNLKSIIQNILKKYGKSELMVAIYTSIKELAINATKANMKFILFDEMNLNYDDPDDYKKGMAVYKERLTEKWVKNYAYKCKEKNISVKISFSHNEDGMRVVIKNNIAISVFDEKRIRKKLSKVMQYDDIVQYYMDNADETEGQGLGIGLIVILLKGENIDPQLFRIGIVDRNTTARIEIPFNNNFISLREQQLKEKFNKNENLKEVK